MKENTVRISLLGGSGSGKTSFMGGIVQALVSNAGIYGTPSDPCNIMLKPIKSISADDDIFSEDFDPATLKVIEGAVVANELIEKYYITTKFKDATTTGFISEYEFSLIINKFESCRMIISDYAGELFSNFKSHIKEFPRLAEKLAGSDVLILMADGVEACHNYGNGTQLQQQLYANFFSILLPQLEEEVEKAGKKMTVLIAITKSDSPRIEPQFRADNYEDVSAMLVDKAYSTVYASCVRNDWNFGIIPVSCVGLDKTKVVERLDPRSDDIILMDEVKEGVELCQYNIDIAILYSLYLHIEEMTEYLSQLKQRYERDTKPFSHPAGYKKSEWLQKISECESNINRLSQCKRVLRNHTFADLNTVIHQRLPLNALPINV